MVIFEVLGVLDNLNSQEHFLNAFSVMQYIPTSPPIWERAWRLAWEMDRQGNHLPEQDVVIAAHALHADAAVLTADHHFSHVPGLIVLNQLG
jgi:predicted nucleic acid-binding protein